MFADYICVKCENVDFIQKPYGEDWQEDIKCSLCGSHSERQRGQVGAISSGFHDGVQYNPAAFTPLNKVYGSVGRQAGVESDGE